MNEAAIRALGFASTEEALNQNFYSEGDEEIAGMVYTIVGITPDRNFLGFFNQVKPFIFLTRNDSNRLASIKISENAPISVVSDIEETWKDVYPDYPMQGRFLNETFQSTFVIFQNSTNALVTFALIALFLAAIGLFGPAAFMAEQKTREIGIRKVLGANRKQIVQLLIWQFSQPVLWATPIALGVGYYFSNIYLELFAERIDIPFGFLIGAGLLGLLLAWFTVASHAFKVASTKRPGNTKNHIKFKRRML